MRTTNHQNHIQARTSHNACRECRADTERRFVPAGQWHYDHAADYLAYAAPRLEAIRQGEDSVNARIWLRDFRKALDRRISLKAGLPQWRKMNDSYLERLRGMSHVHNEAYLRRFAQFGASALA